MESFRPEDSSAARVRRTACAGAHARDRARLIALALLALLGAAARADDDDPVDRFSQIEARVLRARSVTIEAEVHADGVLDSDLRGRLVASPGNRLSAQWSGKLRGRPVDIRLQADGQVLVVRSGSDEIRELVAPETNYTVLLGVMRMGLYHNIARAAGLHGPDRESGGADRWIHQEYFHLVHVLGPPVPGAAILNFDVLAEGMPATTARLWLDPVTGLPARREQVLQLESGAATEVETYTRFVVE